MPSVIRNLQQEHVKTPFTSEWVFKWTVLTPWCLCPLLSCPSRSPKAQFPSCLLHPRQVPAEPELFGILHLKWCLCIPPPAGTWKERSHLRINGKPWEVSRSVQVLLSSKAARASNNLDSLRHTYIYEPLTQTPWARFRRKDNSLVWVCFCSCRGPISQPEHFTPFLTNQCCDGPCAHHTPLCKQSVKEPHVLDSQASHEQKQVFKSEAKRNGKKKAFPFSYLQTVLNFK